MYNYGHCLIQIDPMQEDKPPGRRTRKRQGTLDRLVATAGMLFARDGYEAVTMEQIAETADVARATLYNHFPSKEAVLAAWIHQQLAADLQAFFAGQRRRLSLARLLAAPRSLWLLDEPLSPLDADWRARFGDLMAEHLAGGGLIVAAVHDPLPVPALAVEIAS